MVSCFFGWFVARSWWLEARLRDTNLLRITWYHIVEPRKEVVGTWWWHRVASFVGSWRWHLVASLVGWSLGGWGSGAKAAKKKNIVLCLVRFPWEVALLRSPPLVR